MHLLHYIDQEQNMQLQYFRFLLQKTNLQNLFLIENFNTLLESFLEQRVIFVNPSWNSVQYSTAR